MIRLKIMCRRICIYSFIVILVVITAICFLPINWDGLSLKENSSYDIIRAPVRDSIGEKSFGNGVENKGDVVKQNSSYLTGAKEEKHEAVSQIDRNILALIQQIERSDVSIQDRVQQKELEKPKIRNNTCPEKLRRINGVEDLLCMRPPQFLSQYKNPCWHGPTGKFYCLPYFQIIGMDKSGSTDLFDRIAKHPDVLKNDGILQKETCWWSWRRYGHWLKRSDRVKSFEQYTQFFDRAAKTIQPQPGAGIITGDGTPMDMWDMSGWVNIPQNNGLKEPLFITPHLIKHVNSDVKLIIILRDPVERLFSDYFFLKLGKMTLRGFHEEVIRSIRLLHLCTRMHSFRACIYSRNLHVKSNARIHLGFYSLFLDDWLKVFRREQFLILRTEDYSNHTREHIQQAFTFLGLRDLPEHVLEKFANSKRIYVTKSKIKAGNMLPQTRAVLERLYKNFNKKLTNILKDDRFLWEKPS